MKSPACLGGKPLFNFPYEIAPPSLPDLETCAPRLRDAFLKRRLTNFGPYVHEFEAKLAELFQVAAVATVCNATMGLIIALETIGAKGEVIVPSYTFPATGQSVLWAGGRVVFADIEPSIPTLSVESVRSAMSEDTCAIMPMHCFGFAPDMEAFKQLASEARIPLVSDAAEAVGTLYKNQPLAGIGDLDVVSFHATKILSIGEGGAILCNDRNLIREIRMRTNFGFEGKGRGMIEYFGLNAKLAEIPAILGLVQLERLDEMLEKRKEWAGVYRIALNGVPGIKIVEHRKESEPNYQMFNIEINPVDFKINPKVLKWALLCENIVTRFYFTPPCHMQKGFIKKGFRITPGGLSNTEKKCATNLCIPMQPDRPSEEAKKIADSIIRLHEMADKVNDAFVKSKVEENNV